MLVLEMRTSQVVSVAEFDLAPSETLEQRVKQELTKASEEGRLGKTVTRMSVPPVRVRDGAAGNDSSVALFDASGREMTNRTFDVQTQETEVGRTYLLVVKHDDDAEDEIIGSFVDEGAAHRIGALWRAGLID